jgi:hypothetical protein
MYSQIHLSPRDKYKKPQTSSQAVGWEQRDAVHLKKPQCSPRQHRPRLTCPETDFANAYVEATRNSVSGLFSLERFPDKRAAS